MFQTYFQKGLKVKKVMNRIKLIGKVRISEH